MAGAGAAGAGEGPSACLVGARPSDGMMEAWGLPLLSESMCLGERAYSKPTHPASEPSSERATLADSPRPPPGARSLGCAVSRLRVPRLFVPRRESPQHPQAQGRTPGHTRRHARPQLTPTHNKTQRRPPRRSGRADATGARTSKRNLHFLPLSVKAKITFVFFGSESRCRRGSPVGARYLPPCGHLAVCTALFPACRMDCAHGAAVSRADRSKATPAPRCTKVT